MERQIITTADGSHTLAVPGMQVTYHSTHGALQESLHIFIQTGLHSLEPGNEPLHIFEMGFGTGLNALLTMQEQRRIVYHAVEAFPISAEHAAALNYQPADDLKALHAAPWEVPIDINPFFTLHKTQQTLERYLASGKDQRFHLIYFDAFAPDAQPELWTEEIFRQLAAHTHPGGVLVTYCSRVVVRRAMEAAGWKVTKFPGPRGKREIVRAVLMENAKLSHL